MAKEPKGVDFIRPALTSTEKKNFKNQINKINQEYQSSKMPGIIRDRVNKLERLLRNDASNKNLNKIDITREKKDNLGLSPSEIRDQKTRKNLGRSKDKMAPSTKIKGEKEKDLKRLEEIKKRQAAEDAAKKKKAKGRAGRATGVSATAGRDLRSKHFIGKKFNMGGVMKGRGGTFKGVY